MASSHITVLYAGAEASTPNALAEASGAPVVTGPRDLAPFTEQARTQDATLVVVPAGTNRDLTSIAQAAQALQWAQRQGTSVVLGPSLIDATRAIAELRRHLRAAAEDHDAVLFIAATVDPFADAELLRRVRLAQQFSENLLVEVAFEGSWPSVDSARERLRLLGATTVADIRADLVLVDVTTPLFRRSSLATAAERASHTALHLAKDHGDDGIAAGLLADHETGFAHSHGDEGHSHSHNHSHGHSHHH
ncbi:MAG: hypothetical protein L0J74_02350 [Corynebacterium sp.]|uniref:hypothetical protein n=1 Tax=Corynebacterium TaxID=1716 RepID=UPI0026499F14|nr:hypothetical protein [Corynebacterium sp.]MDN6282285.1 hypothetical protein [Corynebacterium sp.]MDN6304640.1 hypothetical protein [Corynebacterium sp.]MDN6368091.1 hypothetical protein [Corynebacterium sp.]MDN6375634.1 hypothetical protein [Corynebacterium sp.]MDN6395239.1 hypothetical protein [Corynebacterium sp.]